jgi:hypothetical protein
MGDIGITSDLPLEGLKVVHDGNVMNGFVQKEGNLSRFVPTTYSGIWQTGTIEVIATLSPRAMSGATTKVLVQATDASFDKNLIVVPSDQARVEVLALLSYAPAVITSDDSWTEFKYTCPAEVVAGCQLVDFNISARGKPFRVFKVKIGTYGEIDLPADASGTATINVYWNIPVSAGQTLQITVTDGAHIVQSLFQNFLSISGGKKIEPIRSTGCTASSDENCKG